MGVSRYPWNGDTLAPHQGALQSSALWEQTAVLGAAIVHQVYCGCSCCCIPVMDPPMMVTGGTCHGQQTRSPPNCGLDQLWEPKRITQRHERSCHTALCPLPLLSLWQQRGPSAFGTPCLTSPLSWLLLIPGLSAAGALLRDTWRLQSAPWAWAAAVSHKSLMQRYPRAHCNIFKDRNGSPVHYILQTWHMASAQCLFPQREKRSKYKHFPTGPHRPGISKELWQKRDKRWRMQTQSFSNDMDNHHRKLTLCNTGKM